jgi:hypothetical protein
VFGRRRRTGFESLATWLKRRAARAGEYVAVEDALLAGRFPRYALRRLAAFVLARGWGVALHILELTWLAQVFSAKPFIASLALQNATLIIDAWLFGALEGLRRRSRELGPGNDATALATRWLTVAIWSAVVIMAVPLGRAAWDFLAEENTPSLFHVYAMVCALRLAADVVLRTYYSGVFAHHRVYRPLWTPLVSPTVIVGITLLLWAPLAGWGFPIALAASVGVSRALLFMYTRRAYRFRRIPAPRWRLRWTRRARPRPRSDKDARVNRRLIRDAVLGGAANTTTRLGAVVLLAAVIPSLTRSDVFENEAPAVEPFAFALHVAAPLLYIASQWGLVFYHDWKRVEGELAETLAHHLHRRILVTAVVVAIFSWAAASGLVLVWVPLIEAWLTLAALFPGMLGLSIWTALQLRGFARGEFVRQVASASAMLLVLWLALSATFLGTDTWYVALAAGPWAAIALDAVFGLFRRPPAIGEVESLAAWERTLRATRVSVTVWEARAVQGPARVVTRITSMLADRGAVVRTNKGILWFECAPFTPRDEWLRAGAGALVFLEGGGPAAPGGVHGARLEASGRLGRPSAPDLEALTRAFMRRFPDGLVLHVGRAAPRSFLALAASVRQGIWRDALRTQRAMRSRSGWFVTVFAPKGTTEVVFATPRPVTSEAAAGWYAELAPFNWRQAATAADRSGRDPERDLEEGPDRGTRGGKVAEEGEAGLSEP